MNSEVLFQTSPYWILLCLAVGVLYAYFLYRRQSSLSRWQRIGLAAVRAAVVAGISFLLLNPLIHSQQTVTEPPKLVLAVDNSRSMTANRTNAQLVSYVKQVAEGLKTKGVDVILQTISGNSPLPSAQAGGLRFSAEQSNLGQFISQLRSTYENEYLTDVVLLSDGIATAGVSPLMGTYPFRVHTIAVGDTTPARDARVAGVFANQLVYAGDPFQIEAEIAADGLSGKSAVVQLKSGNAVIGQQTVTFSGENAIQRVRFSAKGMSVGRHRYTVHLSPLTGERTTRNNVGDVVVEVVDGKLKILVVGAAPHPDLAAIRTILNRYDRYEVQVKVAGAVPPAELTSQNFDLLVLHQLPDIQGGSRVFLADLLAKNKPVWFIVGAQSDLPALNSMQQAIGFMPKGGRLDQVAARPNAQFSRFNFNPEQLSLLSRFPQLQLPFADYNTAPSSEVILYQQVGAAATQRPLLLINSLTPRKVALWMGEGLWRWRLEEFELKQTHQLVDDLVLKTVQLITTKEDKRKLRVYTSSPTYQLHEAVQFHTELYNAIYERISSAKINLTVQNESGFKQNYSYTIGDENAGYEVGDFPAGSYVYKASTTVDGKVELAEGSFMVTSQSTEDLSTTADFGMLRTLAAQTNGKFVKEPGIAGLIDYLASNLPPARLSANEDIREIIHLRWLLGLFIALLTIEWAARKYIGL